MTLQELLNKLLTTDITPVLTFGKWAVIAYVSIFIVVFGFVAFFIVSTFLRIRRDQKKFFGE